MEKKKCGLIAAIASVLAVIIVTLSRIGIASFFEWLLVPILLVGAISFVYIGFKNYTVYKSKLLWIVASITYLLLINSICNLPFNGKYIFETIELFGSIYGVKEIFTAGLSFVVTLIYILSSALILASLFCEKLSKLLGIGISIRVLPILFSVIANKSFSIFTLLEIILIAVLVVLTLNISSVIGKILKYVVIALCLINIAYTGVLEAIAWICLAYVLVGAKKPIGFKLSKATAILCMVTAVISAVLFFASEPFNYISSISEEIGEIKLAIEENEVRIARADTTIRETTPSLESQIENVAEIKKDFDEAKYDLTLAKNTLSRYCSRSYYSTWYCSAKCKSLHDDVDTYQSIYSSVNKRYNDAINNRDRLQNTIDDAEQDKNDASNNIVRIESELDSRFKNLGRQLVVVLVLLLAIGLSCAGLICIGICLFKEKYEKLALVSCALISGGALLFLLESVRINFSYFIGWPIENIGMILMNPAIWTIAAMALVALLMSEKTTRRVLTRVFIIIFSLFVLALSTRFSLGVTTVGYGFFALCLILISLTLVPTRFTEYNSIAKHIFFTIITFGIWHLIWIYNVTKNLNKVEGTVERKPWLALLLCIVLPFYYIYWILKTAEAVEVYGSKNGKSFRIDILCLALCFVCPIIATSVIQDKINLIVGKSE